MKRMETIHATHSHPDTLCRLAFVPSHSPHLPYLSSPRRPARPHIWRKFATDSGVFPMKADLSGGKQSRQQQQQEPQLRLRVYNRHKDTNIEACRALFRKHMST